MRLEDYKLILQGKQKPELYNLTKDIKESEYLYEKEPVVADKMKTMYLQWKVNLPEPAWTAQNNVKKKINNNQCYLPDVYAASQ